MPTIQQVAYPALLLLADQNARDLRNGADEFQPSISEAAYRAARDLFPRVVVDLPGRLPDASHAHDVGFQQGASLADWDLIVGEEYPTYRVPEGISEFGLGAEFLRIAAWLVWHHDVTGGHAMHPQLDWVVREARQAIEDEVGDPQAILPGSLLLATNADSPDLFGIPEAAWCVGQPMRAPSALPA